MIGARNAYRIEDRLVTLTLFLTLTLTLAPTQP
jgi:hypothetical protein